MDAQNTTLSVQLAVKTIEVRKSLSRIIQKFDGLTLEENTDSPWVDILVLEIGSNPSAEFETIKALLQENVVGNLFLTSPKTTADILLPALRAGAREFFTQPIDVEEVKAAFQKVKDQAHNQNTVADQTVNKGKIYSVLGAKGGVGTTTFAVNFATSIQARDKNKSVALIDMNRLVGEVPLFLDLETDTNWEDIGRNISRLDAAYLQSAMVRHSSGVYVLPAPGKVDTEKLLPAGSLFQVVKSMRNFFDYIVVDGGMYFDENLFKIFTESEQIYLVSILSLPCIINVRKLQQSVFAANGVTNGRLRIIANRFEKKAQVSLAEANKIIGTDISATIPNNYALSMTAINNGKSIADVSRNSNIARAYSQLAESVADSGLERAGGIFSWFSKN
ncbi:AAA family ATPase [Desulfopila inferna]|uniref:AAA family ATPase n=1 Tax=Desulfopila inferna TaxID=468528 RepID=UPI0019653376|nr:hypothetical protein [Desulfopila inferna]MBM9603824.1 hypothetical protein [Desulfopila inferna]